MLNMMCAIRMVVSPRLKLIEMNRVRSDEPITISGVAIGRKITKLVTLRPRKL